MLRERNGDYNPAYVVIGKDTRRSSYMFEYMQIEYMCMRLRKLVRLPSLKNPFEILTFMVQ